MPDCWRAIAALLTKWLISQDRPRFDGCHLGHAYEPRHGEQAWIRDLDSIYDIVLGAALSIVTAIAVPYRIVIIVLKRFIIIAATIVVDVLEGLCSGLGRFCEISEISPRESNL